MSLSWLRWMLRESVALGTGRTGRLEAMNAVDACEGSGCAKRIIVWHFRRKCFECHAVRNTRMSVFSGVTRARLICGSNFMPSSNFSMAAVVIGTEGAVGSGASKLRCTARRPSNRIWKGPLLGQFYRRRAHKLLAPIGGGKLPMTVTMMLRFHTYHRHNYCILVRNVGCMPVMIFV